MAPLFLELHMLAQGSMIDDDDFGGSLCLLSFAPSPAFAFYPSDFLKMRKYQGFFSALKEMVHSLSLSLLDKFTNRFSALSNYLITGRGWP